MATHAKNVLAQMSRHQVPCMQGATVVDRAKWRPVATHAKNVLAQMTSGALHAGCHSGGQGKMEARGNPRKKCPCSNVKTSGALHARCHSGGQGKMEARGNPCKKCPCSNVKTSGVLHAGCHSGGQSKMEARGNPCKKMSLLKGQDIRCPACRVPQWWTGQNGGPWQRMQKMSLLKGQDIRYPAKLSLLHRNLSFRDWTFFSQTI